VRSAKIFGVSVLEQRTGPSVPLYNLHQVQMQEIYAPWIYLQRGRPVAPPVDSQANALLSSGQNTEPLLRSMMQGMLLIGKSGRSPCTSQETFVKTSPLKMEHSSIGTFHAVLSMAYPTLRVLIRIIAARR